MHPRVRGRRYANIGDGSSVPSRKLPGGTVKKGDVVRAVVVRTTGIHRKDGTVIRLTERVVILKMMGTRKGRVFSVPSRVSFARRIT